MPPPTLGALLAALQLQQAELWRIGAYGAGVITAGLAFAAAARLRGRQFVALLCVPAAALAGFGFTGLHAALRLADSLPEVIEGRDLLVTGVVAGMPQPGATGLRFRFEVEHASLDGASADAATRIARVVRAAR